MPRKTPQQRLAETTEPAAGTIEHYRIERLKSQIRQTELQSRQREMQIAKMNGDLIPKSEVREMFGRVFGAYRAATKEIDRRYGPDAASILIQAERSALRTDQEENKCQTSGEASRAKPAPPAKSPPLRKRKS